MFEIKCPFLKEIHVGGGLTVQELQCLGLRSFLVIHINAVFQSSMIRSDELA
jgi:hypothetical protein